MYIHLFQCTLSQAFAEHIRIVNQTTESDDAFPGLLVVTSISISSSGNSLTKVKEATLEGGATLSFASCARRANPYLKKFLTDEVKPR